MGEWRGWEFSRVEHGERVEVDEFDSEGVDVL